MISNMSFEGLRSDLDLFTYEFPWKPWTGKDSISRGPEIVRYLQETASEDGLCRKLKLGRRVTDISWSSENAMWTVDLLRGCGAAETMRSRFVYLATGYYDTEKPLQTSIPGISQFGGRVVHPQFWPDDLDYAGKNVVIIGSGATAITLLPAMADQAKHVTMLQRSPSYVLSVPREDWMEKVIRTVCPTQLAAKCKSPACDLSLRHCERRHCVHKKTCCE